MTGGGRRYRVVIVEASLMVSTGLKQLLEEHRQLEVVAVIADYYHYAERIQHLQPDAVVINPSVLDAKRRQHPGELFPGLRNTAFVALVYQYMEPETLRSYHAVIDIADDGERATQKLLGAIERVSAPADGGERNELSEREKEVLVALARGRINKEIAEMYHISIHTVITHRKNIIRKTGIKSVSGLTVYAILNNLISIHDVE